MTLIYPAKLQRKQGYWVREDYCQKERIKHIQGLKCYLREMFVVLHPLPHEVQHIVSSQNHSHMRAKRVFDLLEYNLERHNKDVVLAVKRSGKWVTFSTREYVEYANLISYGLMTLGVGKGDKVATVSYNRPEWNFADMGILQIGAIHVPVFPNVNDEDLLYILQESEAKVLFAGNRFIYAKILEIKEHLPNLLKVYCYDEAAECVPYSELIELGRMNPEPEKLIIHKHNVQPDDLASIIYTSGTTGSPKGVMLTHENHVSNVLIAANNIRLKPEYRYLSYLPLSHSYERMVNYIVLYLGLPTYYADGVSNILTSFREVKPHVMVSVPLLLEKIYQGILKKGMELKGIKAFIFNRALSLAEKYELHKDMGAWYKWQMKIADRLVFSKWRQALGGKMIKIICGGASVQPHLMRIFWAAGIPVYEGYGLTEAAPLIAFNTEDDVKVGTVGKPIPDVLVKISEDGEVLVKGPNVMAGYYMHPKETQEVIDAEGWLHTGDIGNTDEEGFLRITGRIKEAFKISSGLYVFPERLENRLKQSFFISQALVAGDNKNYLTALIQPNFEYLSEYFNRNGIKFSGPAEMIIHPSVQSLFREEVKKINGPGIKENETIQKYLLVGEEWTIETGELTPSLKLKRKILLEKYKQQLNALYKDEVKD